MSQGSLFWKEAVCRKDFSTLVGQMKVNVKLVTKRKVQKSTGFAIVQVGMKSGAKSQRSAGSGNKKQERRRRNVNGKEVLSRILKMKASGTWTISV